MIPVGDRLVLLDVEHFHALLRDLEAFLIDLFNHCGPDLQAGLLCRRIQILDDDLGGLERNTCQFLLTSLNRWCSIVFHFDAPVG